MLTINCTCETAINVGVVISLLVSGSTVLIVNANGLTKPNTEVICSDTAEISETYILKKGMNYSLPGYTEDRNIDSGVENIVMDKDKIYNLKKLNQISQLKDGWNGNKAKVFQTQLIDRVRSIITVLPLQPELFPTACDSLQLEYEKGDGSYLEIEATLEDMWEVFEIDDNGKEKYFSIPAEIETIIKVVNSFYG